MLSQNIPYIYEIYNNGINDLGKERLLFLEYSPCSDEKKILKLFPAKVVSCRELRQPFPGISWE